ncbi:MAG: ABC transporter substrate-binding protein [Paludibacter sp.]
MIKKLFFLITTLCLIQSVSGQNRTITDMAGRKVSIPQKINRILPHDEKTSLFLFPVTGKRMSHRGLSKDASDLKYMSREYRQLPEIDIMSTEEVIKAAPDMIIVGCFIPDDYSRYERLSKQTNIPMVVIDLNIFELDKSYQFLNNLLGQTPKAKSCIAYLTAFYNELAQIQKSNKKRNASVYVAVGNDGLRTAPSGSKHAQLLDLLNIKNAAQTEIQARGYADVSIEQIMIWKPDFIFTVDKTENDPFPVITSSKLWKDIPAVQKKYVIHIPEEPYSWFGNPPSINRIPGLIVLMELFYNYPRAKGHQQIKDFYKLFYNYPLSDVELAKLLVNRS